MATISSLLKLRQIRRHSTGLECDKEPFGENSFSISSFVNEIIQINENIFLLLQISFRTN